MSVADLPALNALLNACSAVLLFFGYVNIRRRRRQQHKRFMLAALVFSALFLTSYLIYHAQVGSVPYPYHDWTRPLYFIILIPHVLFAGLMTPFIVLAVWYALHERFDKHRRLVRYVWPVWMYVSFSGVLIYLMLYQF